MRVFTTVVGLTLSLLPGPAAGPPGRQTTMTVSRDGMILSLRLPGTVYPRNALVPAVVTLSNRSRRSVTTWDCLADSLGAEVLRSEGVEAYPPLLPPPGAPWNDCTGAGMPMRHVVPVGVGATLVRRVYLVLRYPTVGAWASLAPDRTAGKPLVLSTHPLRIRTLAAPGPRLRLVGGTVVRAEITPVSGSGPILYSQYVTCRHGRGARFADIGATMSRWTDMGRAATRLDPPCRSLAEWILFVGQVGRPVAQAYYCARHDLCNYAPPTPQDRAVIACKDGVANAIEKGRLPRVAARYAIGLDAQLPPGLNPVQRRLAVAFHNRCTPLLHRHH